MLTPAKEVIWKYLKMTVFNKLNYRQNLYKQSPEIPGCRNVGPLP